MDPIKTYDYLTRSRQRLFDWVRPLNAEQYTRPFPIGPGSLAKTLTHVLISERYYVQRIQEEPVPPYAQWPIRDEEPPEFAVLEAAWVEQVGKTRAAVVGVRDWKKALEYRVTDDSGKRIEVTASPEDIFTQLVLHEVHHRAQVLNMLRQLGVKLEDIDFNAIMYQRRDA